MPDSDRIRLATQRDRESVEALLRASYPVLMAATYDPATLGPALEIMTRASPALLASERFYVSVAADGAVVGCGGWSRERPGSGEVEPGLAHVRHFAVHPNRTGRGLGRRILERCESAARAAGVRRLECYSSLNAEGFYAALGFVRVGPLDVELGGGIALPGVRMHRAL